MAKKCDPDLCTERSAVIPPSLCFECERKDFELYGVDVDG